MRKPLYIFLLFCLTVVLIDCKKDTGPNNFGDFPPEVGKIMVYKCATAGCHNNLSYAAAANLNLSTWNDLFKGSSSGSSVIPYRSDFSSLCYFINSFPELGPINYPSMPFNATALSYEEVKTIKDWIDAGAPDIKGNIKWTDNPNRSKYYVVNQGCDVVTVLDSETQLPIRYITVGNNPGNIEVPHIVKISPDQKYWYVVFLASNLLQKFRCSDDVLVGQVSLGSNMDWNTIVITDDGKKAFCVAWTGNGHIASVDLEKMKLIRNYGGFPFPHGVALNGTNDTIYVTAQSGNFIFKLDTAFNNSEQISIQPGFSPNSISSLDPHEIILSPDKKKFYITCQKSNDIRVFDIATKTISDIIPNIYYPQEMVLSPAKNKLYITCTYDTTSFTGAYGTVVCLDLSNLSVQKNKVGFMPHGVGINESKNVLYVASRNILSSGPAPHHSSVCSGRNGFINYIDLNSFQVSNKRTEISVDPYAIGVRN